MKQIIFAASLVVLPLSPLVAEEEKGLSLMERGAQLFLEGIIKEMEPAIEDLSALAEKAGPAMRGFLDEMGPALADLLKEVEDWSVYDAPEILPNGDIIIRRKPPVEKAPLEEKMPDKTPPEGDAIDL